MLEAIEKEIITEKNFIEGEIITTIYLGGGTPSVLDTGEINSLLDTIRRNYTVDTKAEITLEANPDDINPGYLAGLKDHGVNRLSIGIQSFNDEDLKLMNRRHDSRQAKASLEISVNAGFDNLSLDLIYGIPGMNNEMWKKNIEMALSFNTPHLAAYHLTYEQGTVMDFQRRKKTIKPVDENRSFDHFVLLKEKMKSRGYEHYEISNFALPGKISRHNSAYWKGEKYLGVGPSAHSYNGKTRRWNISKNSSYIRGINNKEKIYDEEVLNTESRMHDYLMTSLRTMWGADLIYLEKEWGGEYYNHVLHKVAPFIQSGKVLNIENKLILTKEKMFIADHIIAELFL